MPRVLWLPEKGDPIAVDNCFLSYLLLAFNSAGTVVRVNEDALSFVVGWCTGTYTNEDVGELDESFRSEVMKVAKIMKIHGLYNPESDS